MTSLNNTRNALYVTALLCSSAIIPVHAFAQDGDANVRVRDEIVVTATRRETSVTDVPYNITAISGNGIEDAKVFDSAELLRSIPGVNLVDRGARNSGTLNQVRIRGLSVDNNGLGDYAVSSVASVSTYVNETPIFAGFMLRDLERVEVLRGPQGTLYGSGSLGGTIRYITRAPVLGEFGGLASGSVSKVNGSGDVGYSVDGTLNVPLGENAALRVVGSYGDYPGVTDYVNLYELDANGIPVAPDGILAPTASYRSQEDADTVEQWMGRATLLWEPTDAVSVSLMHARQHDDVGGRRAQTVGVDGYGNTYGDQENGSIQLEPSLRDVNTTALEVNVDLGFATLTSSTSHYDHNGDSTSENTGFYAQAGFLGFYYNYPRPMASAVRSYADEAVVQEIRLVSDAGEKFDYVVGGFYRRQQLQSTQQSYLRGFKNWWDAFLPFAAGAVTGDQDFAYDRVENFEEMAVFGELTYHISDAFDFTFGARYFDNDSKNTTYMDLPLYTSVSSPSTSIFESGESDILFKGNVSWRYSDDDMIYATISEGYRRGGSNAVPLFGPFAEDAAWQIYNADSVVNYEVGIKGKAGYNLTYDLSAFYIDWSDPQLNTATPVGGFFAVQNGGKAATKGIEAQLDGYFADDAWHYNLGYAYVDAKLTKDVFSPVPGTTVPSAVDGAMLPGTPKHKLNWAIDYTRPVGNWSWFTRVDGSYQSETRNAVTVATSQNVPIDSFSIWNATTSISKGPVSVSLWVKNIFDADGVTGIFTEAYMGTAPTLGYFGNGNKELLSLPRTIGLTGSYGF